MLAPGGVRVVGSSLLGFLTANALSSAEAAISVFALRLTTAGLTIASMAGYSESVMPPPARMVFVLVNS